MRGDIGEGCDLDLWGHVTFQVKMIMQESETCRQQIQPDAFPKDNFKLFTQQDLRSIKGWRHMHDDLLAGPCE